jgi:hypothetical protein
MQSSPQPASSISAPPRFLSLALRAPVAARLRLVVVCLLGLVLVHVISGDVLGSGYLSLGAALAPHGLSSDGQQARALAAQRRGDEPQLIVFRAAERGELMDVYVGEAVVASDGRVAALSNLHNLTRTASAEETMPVLLGNAALFARKLEGEYVALELLTLDGEPPSEQGFAARLRRGVSNLQSTGQWAGVGRRSYTLRAPARALSVRTDGGSYVVQVDRDRAVIDPVLDAPTEGAALFEVRSHVTAVAELVPWAVDTVREISWIGPEKIAWLENKVFAVRDRFKRAYHSVKDVDHAAEAAEELGGAVKKEEAQKVARLAVPDPDSGWPPPAIKPTIEPDVPGEGAWRAIVDDAHVRELPSGAPVFYQTFVRADPQRNWARVYLTVWDPRLVQLHIVSGTEEPVSATGETGTGKIPRTPDTLGRLVGAFNGGFQAVHGEFGMMADGRVYLPPKPWAATVAVFKDGRVGMGSWPGPSDRKAGYDEAKAVAELPADIVSYRQNLTSLVEDGRFNPWGRWWWGAAPQNKSEQTLTQRSALCFTREGFMIYAWGDSASPEAMGAALVSARCVRAMHLDMNSGHSGMEFYNVLADGEPRDPVGKKEGYRYEAALKDLPGFTVRARKAVTSMGLSLPRYILPDPRDYFYLTLKPGVVTTSAHPAGAAQAAPLGFESKDLPHAGWPPALARSAADATILVRIDPARAVPSAAPPAGGQTVLAELRGPLDEPKLDDSYLFATPEVIGQRYAVGVAPQGAQVVVRGALLASSPRARSALGVDAAGLLVYGETGDTRDGALQAAMARAGVSAAIALPERVRLGLGFREGVLAVDGTTRLREPDAALRFVAARSPAVEVMYPDNKPMPYSRWAQLQDQRVRYFRTAPPTSMAPSGVLAPGSQPGQ